MSKAEDNLAEKLDEALSMAFVGLWIRNEDGDFVELDDAYDVLKADLRSDLLNIISTSVTEARYEGLMSENVNARSLVFGIEARGAKPMKVYNQLLERFKTYQQLQQSKAKGKVMSNTEDMDWLDDVVLKPAGWQYDDYQKAKQTIIAKVQEMIREVKYSEVKKVWTGMNTAAGIRDVQYTARDLNLDDLSYYLHNRLRVLYGKKAHTPEEWLEDER